MAQFNKFGHFDMRKGTVLFAITGEIPDAVLSHRFAHEHASLNAAA